MFKWLVGRRKREKKSEDSAEDEPDATQLEVKKGEVKSEDTGKPRKTTQRINPFTDGINLIEISVWADDLKLTSRSTLGLVIKASTTLWRFIQLCTAPRSMLGYFMLLCHRIFTSRVIHYDGRHIHSSCKLFIVASIILSSYI